jgi:hypothetical protein
MTSTNEIEDEEDEIRSLCIRAVGGSTLASSTYSGSPGPVKASLKLFQLSMLAMIVEPCGPCAPRSLQHHLPRPLQQRIVQVHEYMRQNVVVTKQEAFLDKQTLHVLLLLCFAEKT